MVVGIPHPSHPFTEPYPTVYETPWATWRKLPMDEILMFARWRGLIVHPIVCEHLGEILKVPK